MKDRVITSEEGEMIDRAYDKGHNDGYKQGLEAGKELMKEFAEFIGNRKLQLHSSTDINIKQWHGLYTPTYSTEELLTKWWNWRISEGYQGK